MGCAAADAALDEAACPAVALPTAPRTPDDACELGDEAPSSGCAFLLADERGALAAERVGAHRQDSCGRLKFRCELGHLSLGPPQERNGVSHSLFELGGQLVRLLFSPEHELEGREGGVGLADMHDEAPSRQDASANSGIMPTMSCRVSRLDAPLMYLIAPLRGLTSDQRDSQLSPDVKPEPDLLRAPNSCMHSCTKAGRRRETESMKCVARERRDRAKSRDGGRKREVAPRTGTWPIACHHPMPIARA